MQEAEGSQRGHQSPRMCVSVVGHGRTTVESIKLSQTTPTHLKFTRNPGTQGQPVGGVRLLRQSASVACSTEKRPEALKWERGGGVLFWMVPLDLGWKRGKGQSCGSPGCCQHVLQSGSQAVSTRDLMSSAQTYPWPMADLKQKILVSTLSSRVSVS